MSDDLYFHQLCTHTHKLTVIGGWDVPTQIHKGIIIDRVDVKTTHEGADIILIQQMIDTDHEEHTGFAVPSTDTDVCVCVLLVYYDLVSILSIYLIIQSPVRDRSVTDIQNTAQKQSGIARDLFAAQVVPVGIL